MGGTSKRVVSRIINPTPRNRTHLTDPTNAITHPVTIPNRNSGKRKCPRANSTHHHASTSVNSNHSHANAGGGHGKHHSAPLWHGTAHSRIKVPTPDLRSSNGSRRRWPTQPRGDIFHTSCHGHHAGHTHPPRTRISSWRHTRKGPTLRHTLPPTRNGAIAYTASSATTIHSKKSARH